MVPRLIRLEGEKRVFALRAFRNEAELQSLLETTPEAIPLQEADQEAAPLTMIGREVGVESGAMDLLYVDASGLLTVVETKLVASPEARRQVVAQVLEYASQMAKWEPEDVERLASKYLQGGDLYTRLAECQDQATGERGQFRPEEFRDALRQNLRAGRIRMVIAVDGENETLRDLVTFVNSHSTFDVLLLELAAYSDTPDGLPQFLVPSLYGYAQKTGLVPPEQLFLARARESHAPLEPMTQLLQFAKEKADRVWWGRGKVYPSFTFHSFAPDGRPVSLFSVYSNGEMTLNFGWMVERVPEQVYRHYKEALRAVPGLQFSDAARWPSFSVSMLAGPEAMAKFKQAVAATVEEIRSLTSEQSD